MALIQLEMYDALKAAGCPEPEARAAAMEVATMGGLLPMMAERLNRIHRKLNVLLGMMLIGFSAMLAACWQIFLRLPR
jgi:hypothetical protein